MTGLLVCARVAYGLVPVTGSIVRRCHLCGADVWISPASIGHADNADIDIRCWPCAEPIFHPAGDTP